ncbi:MAG: hypothetical protein AAB658_19055 [Chloroflexota bacterium]
MNEENSTSTTSFDGDRARDVKSLLTPLQRAWLVTALFILVFATPALIDKRRQRSANRPPDYHPLVVWLLAVALFALGAATRQLWPAVIYCVTAGLAVAIFAIRGARW